MASFQFTRSVPSQGTTFVFGSWVCIADSAGSFRRFLVDMKPKTPAASFCSNVDKFVDNLDDSSIHGSATRIEEESAFGATPSSAATTLLGLDSFQSKVSRSRSRLGLRNLATDLQEASTSESLSTLEKDLDSLLQLGKPEATARRGATGCFGANSLMVTSTQEGRFVHWKGMKLSDLLEAKDRLVAHLEPLPFQEGRPLATMAEETTELVDASSDELISRQVLMAEEGEDDGDLPIVEFDAVSEDEATANADNENNADREARRTRNRAHAARRRRVNECMRSMHRELDAEFAAVSERGFTTPVANIARVTAILERSNDPTCIKHFVTHRGLGFSLINKTRCLPSGRSAWAKAEAKLTVERQAAVLDLSVATTTTTPVGVRSLAGGSSHLQGVTYDRPIIGLLQKTCASESMKDAMYDP
jgi:hypothetical protein